MITSLRIKNFKAWSDSKPIRFAPITVLFGTNSAGKTSIPQLLLLLKQTAESADRLRPLHLGDSRTLVDLGTYHDVVHHHKVDAPLGFELGWRLPEKLAIRDPLKRKTAFTTDKICFAAEIKGERQNQPYVHSMSYTLGGSGDGALSIGLRRQESGGKYELTTEGDYTPVRQPGRAWALPGPYHFFGFPDEAVAYYQNTAFVSDLVLALQKELKSIHYVGPLREYPRRLYLWSGEVPPHVGVKGDRAVEALLAAKGRKFNFLHKGKSYGLDELVARRLQQMGLIESFKVQPLGEHRKEYEVLVRTRSGLPEVRLTDVGFGVSQVLPVIVESLYVPAKSIVIFEQPEIHLHPRVQADLADMFIDAIHAREEGVSREVQFIIESHSEHFLRRLQRRLAEEKLKPDEAALYFVDTVGDSAQIRELDIDKFGNIRNWPKDFFGDEMADLVARAEAQARRVKAAKKGEK